MEAHLKTSQIADQLHVSPETIRRWQREGRIQPDHTTPGGHARWSQSQIDELSELLSKSATPPIVESGNRSYRSANPLDRFRRHNPQPVEPDPQLHSCIAQYDELKDLVVRSHTPIIACAAGGKSPTGASSIARDIALLVASQDSDMRVLFIDVNTLSPRDEYLSELPDISRSPAFLQLETWRPSIISSAGQPSTGGMITGLLALETYMGYDDYDPELALAFTAPLKLAENVHYLASIRNDDFDHIDVDEMVAKTIDQFAEQFDLVVVDVRDDIHLHESLLNRTDLLFLSTFPNPNSLIRTRNVFDLITEKMDYTGQVRAVIMDNPMNVYSLDPTSDDAFHIDPELMANEMLRVGCEKSVIMWRQRLDAEASKRRLPLVFDSNRAQDIANLLNPIPEGRIVRAENRREIPDPKQLEEAVRVTQESMMSATYTTKRKSLLERLVGGLRM